jgi:hypothetical protein
MQIETLITHPHFSQTPKRGRTPDAGKAQGNTGKITVIFLTCA